MRNPVLSAILCLGLAATLAFSAHAAPPPSVYDFTLKSIDGQPTPLSEYHGKVLLLVNVASRCGFTPQYTALESLYEKYKDKRPGHRRHCRQQLHGPGARHQRGDQDLLHQEIQRQLSP
jgi:hypothetical protein